MVSQAWVETGSFECDPLQHAHTFEMPLQVLVTVSASVPGSSTVCSSDDQPEEQTVELPDDATGLAVKEWVSEKYGIEVDPPGGRLVVIGVKGGRLLKDDRLLSFDSRFLKLKVGVYIMKDGWNSNVWLMFIEACVQPNLPASPSPNCIYPMSWCVVILSAAFGLGKTFRLGKSVVFTGKFFRGPVSAVKPKNRFSPFAQGGTEAAAGARALLSVQIAWRRRAIGSARNQILLIPARTRQPILPM